MKTVVWRPPATKWGAQVGATPGPDFLSDNRRGCAPGKVDPEIFFDKQFYALARVVCGSCIFQTACDEWATANNETWGFWGGRRRSRPPGGKPGRPKTQQ
jgi:hypothetical protein